jgi:SNF2 family DNA or RNA helicase
MTELPEKIEDMRTCQLSEMQVQLYRDAISSKGARLLSQIQSAPGQLPYIHIFALLNLLKRICDHPALALNKIEDYQNFKSGKWELFQELLIETLDSGQKLVVFTQYLGMITMMERLLADSRRPFRFAHRISRKSRRDNPALQRGQRLPGFFEA